MISYRQLSFSSDSKEDVGEVDEFVKLLEEMG